MARHPARTDAARTMTQCPKCGAPVQQGAEYCANCGNRLRGGGHGWVVALVALLAAAAGAGIAIAVAGNDSSDTKTVTKRVEKTTTVKPSSTNVTVQAPTQTVTAPPKTVTVTRSTASTG
jgi:zinc-ribbon domain